MVDLPKPFLFKCIRCAHAETSTGLSQDLKHLFEIKKCATCGGPRKFRCPKCGSIATLKRIYGNKEITAPKGK